MVGRGCVGSGGSDVDGRGSVDVEAERRERRQLRQMEKEGGPRNGQNSVLTSDVGKAH